MAYQMNPLITVFLLFLPFLIFRAGLYRKWSAQKRQDGEKPSLIRFMGVRDRQPDYITFFQHKRYVWVQVAVVILMFVPFHLL